LKIRGYWRCPKGNSGIPLSRPPYGYKKDLENPKFWVIDEDAASIVRRIFQLTIDGMGVEQIATLLDREGILTPLNYVASKGMNRGGVRNAPTATSWGKSTIQKMLGLQAYCGDVINFKTYTKSYKNKKTRYNAPEDMAVFRDVHEPIVERAVWERVQEIRAKGTRKRPQKSGEISMFSGILVDCGD